MNEKVRMKLNLGDFSLQLNLKKVFTTCVIWIFLIELSKCDVVLNKCCKIYEYYSNDDECVNYNDTIKEFDYNEDQIFPIERLKHQNFSFKFDTKKCTETHEYFPTSFERFNILDNGSIYRKTSPNVLFSKDSFCLEAWDVNDALRPAVQLCPCLEHLCINKCCQKGQHLSISEDKEKGTKHSFCVDYVEDLEEWTANNINGSNLIEFFTTVYHVPKCDKGFIFELKENYSLFENGSLNSHKYGIIHPKEFCGDFRQMNNSREPAIMVCIEDKTPYTEHMLYAVLSFIGSVFLFATVILHLWLPELAGIHGKCLTGHASCLLVGYICTAVNQIAVKPGRYFGCYFLGYLMQFAFLSSFFWLNIMCMDMSNTFRGKRMDNARSKKTLERKRLIYYSIYAWGGTVVLTLSALLVDFVFNVPKDSAFKPNIGQTRCWFQDDESLFVFFYAPMGALLLANLLFFVYTTYKIVVLSRGSTILRKSKKEGNCRKGGESFSKRERYVLYLKIFALMGVCWLTEILAWAIGGPDEIWYLTNAINILRAVFIFIIFCWKPKVWEGLRKKIPWLGRCIKSSRGMESFTVTDTDQTNSSTLNTEVKEKINSLDAIKMKRNN